mgnify:CR=1 FL=1
MIDDMIAGIAKRLREALPCRIYKNPVPQGLERPCFLINPILFTRVQQLGARERRIYSFDVVYLPKTEERSEIYRVMNVLMRALRIIDTDFAGKLLGLTATPSLGAIAIAFGVSVGIGILFGYLPAKNAAKLNPIDALRHE